MAKREPPETHADLPAVTLERAMRLYRLVQILATGPHTRDALRRRLRIDVRSFYRDLELVRASGIEVPLEERRYRLASSEKVALALLPFPDPRLRLGEVVQLVKGRTAAHQKLRDQLEQMTTPGRRKRGTPGK